MYIYNILITLTGVVYFKVFESSVALQVYTPACEVLREFNISSREYVGSDPVTLPTVTSELVEITVPSGIFQVIEGVPVSTYTVTLQVTE